MLKEPQAPKTAKVTMYSQYDDEERSEQMIQKGQHRWLVGAKWEEMGNLQFEFMKSMGLEPHHKFLDVGCGCLRAGVKIIPYLDPNNYYGIDAERRLLDVGYSKEIKRVDLTERLARNNLFCSRLFKHGRLPDASIDFGICVSVMTHLPYNFIRLCLENVAQYFKVGGKLYMTFFELPEDAQFSMPFKNAASILTFGSKDPYHYYWRDMQHAAVGCPWDVRYIGDWKHPRGQKMVEYTKR